MTGPASHHVGLTDTFASRRNFAKFDGGHGRHMLRVAGGMEAEGRLARKKAELAPADIRQLFICHKELFYSTYATWPDNKRQYGVNFLAREYLVDKAGARDALFGHEAAMEEPAGPPPLPGRATRAGPWGAVRRR